MISHQDQLLWSPRRNDRKCELPFQNLPFRIQNEFIMMFRKVQGCNMKVLCFRCRSGLVVGVASKDPRDSHTRLKVKMFDSLHRCLLNFLHHSFKTSKSTQETFHVPSFNLVCKKIVQKERTKSYFEFARTFSLEK